MNLQSSEKKIFLILLVFVTLFMISALVYFILNRENIPDEIHEQTITKKSTSTPIIKENEQEEEKKEEKCEPAEIGNSTEQRLKKEIEECVEKLDLSELDFEERFWNQGLSTDLKGVSVLRAVEGSDRSLCGAYDKKDVDLGLHNVRCERDYDLFFMLTDKLKNGISSDDYVKGCQDAVIPNLLVEKAERIIDIPPLEVLRPAVGEMCRSYYESYSQQIPVILLPDLMCDEISSSSDIVIYTDKETGEQRECLGEHGEKIKFFIAISKNDSSLCSDIGDPRIMSFCQYYFDNEKFIEYREELKEKYCHDEVNSKMPIE